MKQKSLLASALTVLALTAVPAAPAVAAGLRLTSPTPIPTEETGAPTESMMPTESGAPGMTEPFGPGCASLPTSGAGSPSEMATQPVATAIASSSDLSTLSKAIEQAGLTEKLNSAKDITVFAPTNAAFEKIPKEKLDKLLADKEKLTKLLTYHVVEGKKTPQDLTEGELTTLEGAKLKVTGSGEEYTVNDAKVVCGDIQTSNAVVYLVDGVLKPQ